MHANAYKRSLWAWKKMQRTAFCKSLNMSNMPEFDFKQFGTHIVRAVISSQHALVEDDLNR